MAHWSVRQKLNRVSSVQLRRYARHPSVLFLGFSSTCRLGRIKDE